MRACRTSVLPVRASELLYQAALAAAGLVCLEADLDIPVMRTLASLYEPLSAILGSLPLSLHVEHDAMLELPIPSVHMVAKGNTLIDDQTSFELAVTLCDAMHELAGMTVRGPLGRVLELVATAPAALGDPAARRTPGDDLRDKIFSLTTTDEELWGLVRRAAEHYPDTPPLTELFQHICEIRAAHHEAISALYDLADIDMTIWEPADDDVVELPGFPREQCTVVADLVVERFWNWVTPEDRQTARGIALRLVRALLHTPGQLHNFAPADRPAVMLFRLGDLELTEEEILAQGYREVCADPAMAARLALLDTLAGIMPTTEQ